MSKLKPTVSALLLAAACAPAGAQAPRARADVARREAREPLVILDGTRETDGLRGPVRRVETEVVRIEVRQGQKIEQPPSLMERTLYDERGRRVENETHPLGGDPAGQQESHRYDERGNVVETVVRDAAGAVLSRRSYEYEFDERGNWTRMTTSVAVSNQGRTEYEPFEITRRNITYYAVEDAAATRNGLTTNQNSAPPTQGGTTASQNVAPASQGGANAAAGEKAGERARVEEGAKENGPAASPPAASGRRSLTIKAPPGGEVFDAGALNGRATWLPQPAFPIGRTRLETPLTIPVEVMLDITGRVVGARAQSGPPALREAAEEAARRAAFLPFYVAGRPVRARGIINYSFNYAP